MLWWYLCRDGSEGQGRVSKSGHGDYSNYQDAIAVWEVGGWMRRFGLGWMQCTRVWFVKDICGIICAIFTWLLILYAEYVIIFVMLIPAPSTLHSLINAIIFQFLATMAFSSHVKTMLTDPVSNALCVCVHVVGLWHVLLCCAGMV